MLTAKWIEKAASIVFVLSGILLSAPAHAGGSTATVPIEYIAAREIGFAFKTSAPLNSPLGCSVDTVVLIPPTADNYSAIVSAVLTAFSSGKSIRAWVTSCHSNGSNVAIAVWVY